MLLRKRPQRGAALALEVPVADQVLQLHGGHAALLPGDPGVNDAALLYCLRELPLGVPLLMDLAFRKQRVQDVPCTVLQNEERHFRVRLLYLQGACVLRVPRQASSYRVRAVDIAEAPQDWNEDKANQQLAAHVLPRKGFVCAGTSVLLAPAAKTPGDVAQLLQRRAERGTVAADAHEKQQLLPLQFDFPNGKAVAASLPRALIGKHIFLDTAPVPNEHEPPRRRDLVQVLSGEHQGAVGLVMDAPGPQRSVRLRTETGVALHRLPADALWAKDAADDDEAVRTRLQEELESTDSDD